MYLRTGKITELIVLFSASQNSEGKNLINTIIGIVSMDLSKAFDPLPHDWITAKFKSYGADDKTTELIHDYLTNRRQRVGLGDQL